MDVHNAIAAMTMAATTPNGSPLGKYGAAAATLIAVAVVLCALFVHLAGVLGYGSGTDPFIDSAALLVIGVVLGATALGSTAQQAHEAANAANRRLDALGAPQATTVPPSEPQS